MKAEKLALAAVACLAAFAQGLFAAESGSGAYLLGIKGQGAGITPPPGLFFSNQIYSYSGSVGGSIPFEGGGVGVGVKGQPTVDIASILWVTNTSVLGGNLGFTATVPVGQVNINAQVAGLSARDDVFTFGDPSFGAFVGHHSGKVHSQFGATLFLPIGDYQDGDLANLAKHRAAADVFSAVTWFDPESGVDFSNTVGITFNARNTATDYTTGTEFHWEGSLTKKITPQFSAGVVGYYYKQLTADSGPGTAVLGDFKGEVSALGLTAGYDFMAGNTPVSTRVRYYHEFSAKSRLEGDAVFVSVSMPLSIFK
jgi:hypothetical protein